MKARLTIDIDTDGDGVDRVEEVTRDALNALAWSLLNLGSSQKIGRVWGEAAANGCEIAAAKDAGRDWDATIVVTTGDIDKAVRLVNDPNAEEVAQ